MTQKILTVFGTRPEAIKMAPLVRALAQDSRFDAKVCVTAQHRDMLDQVLKLFQIQPDVDLNVMTPGQDLFQVTTNVMNGMKTVLDDLKPDVVLVHGDTTTTMATSLACFYQQIAIGHVEAGLRTHNMHYPFPEEMNRVVTDAVSRYFFCPTEQSLAHVKQQHPQTDLTGRALVTGNTVIDALLYTLKQSSPDLPINLDTTERMILATVHRRENFGQPLLEICKGFLELVNRFDDVTLVLPVHPNPNVSRVIYEQLGSHKRVQLIEPTDYDVFCHLMNRADLILTDSGGVQEEAPSLGKPVLVLRDETERPEAVEMGTVKLVGPHANAIVSQASELLSNPDAYNAMANQVNPYGDGQATKRILDALH